MKYVEEYRDPVAAQQYAAAIAHIVTRPWTLMEVCGGQTHSIVKYGIDELLPKQVTLVHGPGCPVCVTPLELIDKALHIAAQPNVIFCSFGDMLRVPGSAGDLFSVKANGGDVRIVYSPVDAVQIAKQNPDKQVVFFAVGFETTAPANAMSVFQAKQQGVKNYSILVSHVLVPPAMEAILGSPMNKVQGFLAAGHVCTVMGYREYQPIAKKYKVPIVVTGFEPLDLLQGIYMCLLQLEEGRFEVENQYSRVGAQGRQYPGAGFGGASVPRGASQVARRGRDSAERPGPGGGVCRVRRGDAIRRWRLYGAGRSGVHQRPGDARRSEAGRMHCVWEALHARSSTGRAHGVVGGRVRGVLPLPEAARHRTVGGWRQSWLK